MSKHTKKTYVLHGVAHRDSNEMVCMFFGSLRESQEFMRDLPGRYNFLTLEGVDIMGDEVTIKAGY